MPEETDRANAALSQMNSGLLETDPKRARERNHAEIRMRLGLDSKENGRSRTYSPAMHGPRLPVHQKGRAREVSEPPAESTVDVTESSKRSVTRRVAPSPPSVYVPSSWFTDCPGWVQQRSIVRLAPGEKSSNSREKVGQGTGWLPGVWKLKWGWIRIPGGALLDVNVDCGCNGVDIIDVDVRVFSFCPPSVSQFQKLLRKERTMVRSAVAARSRKRTAHLRLLNLCNAVGASCAGKQRRKVSLSSASISSTTCPDTPWSSRMFSS